MREKGRRDVRMDERSALSSRNYFEKIYIYSIVYTIITIERERRKIAIKSVNGFPINLFFVTCFVLNEIFVIFFEFHLLLQR